MTRRLLRLLPLSLLLTGLIGCGAEFARNQRMWNAYRNSDAYYQSVYTSTVHTGAGTSTCYVTIDRRYGTSETTCYGP
jgi:hypothetical protein